MYLTSTCGSSKGYFPINTKWGATSTLSGILPGGGLRGSDTGQSWRRLGYWRPNQAMARGLIPGQLGDDLTLSADPTLLAIGGGALLLALFLFGKKKTHQFKRRRVAKKRKKLERQLELLS